MRGIFRAVTAFVVMGVAASATAGLAGETARTLGDVPALIRTPEGRELFDEEMVGKPSPDRLGRSLPAGVRKSDVAALLVPAGDRNALNSVGLRRWGPVPDRFVAFACTGGDIPARPTDTPCSSRDDGPLNVYVAVVEYRPGASPRVLAGPIKVDPRVDWRDSGLPTAPDYMPSSNGQERPTAFDRFDLAPYAFAPGVEGFGLRGRWDEGYAGGFTTHGALYLFAVDKGELRQVLSAPMTAFSMLAGDWNDDQTRQHTLDEGALVVQLRDTTTDGRRDLVLKSRLTGWSRLYRWSEGKKAYRPAR